MQYLKEKDKGALGRHKVFFNCGLKELLKKKEKDSMAISFI